MTTGQRITEKRKALGLTQEALGNELGVSRQTVYKWESDGGLPEIEKLVALSRRFGVTVGWLLGVEDAPETASAPESPELTERQLQMVEEIVDRYLAARPRWRRWQKWACAGAIALMIFGAWRLWQGTMDRVDQRLLDFNSQISQVQRSVSQQVNGIASQVQDILDRQNSLLAESGAEIGGYDFTAGERGSVLFSVYAVPKSYQAGMTAAFTAECGGEVRTVEGVLTEGQRFSAELPYPRTDENIALSVSFTLPDGTVETQLLDAGYFNGLYSRTLPSVYVGVDTTHYRRIQNGRLSFTGDARLVFWYTDTDQWDSVATEAVDETIPVPDIRSARLGLFQNPKLIAWAEPCEKPANYQGYEDYHFARLPEMDVSVEDGDLLCVAALVEDVYGRQFVLTTSFFTPSNGQLDFTDVSWMDASYWEPSNWQF